MKCVKSILVIMGALIPAVNGFAQDVLTKRNGDELEVKVIKVSTDEVEYKKWSNPDGPSYVLPKGDVFMIKYQNGDKDVFNETTSTAKAQAQESTSAPTKATPAAENAALIEAFNKTEEDLFKGATAKRKDKKAAAFYGTLGVGTSSVLSSDDVLISFVNEKKSLSETPYKYDGGVVSGLVGDKYRFFEGKFYIEITNKTSQTIYIDKANTFRIEPDGNYHVYYNAQQTTVNQGGGSGGGINLGAVTGALGIGGVVNTLAGGTTVGGGKEHSASTTYTDQKVVAIPPYGKLVLSKDDPIVIKESTLGTDKFKMASFSEDFRNAVVPFLQVGEYKAFSEQDSPATKRYIITYSTDPEFKSSKLLEFSMYIKDVVGLRRRYSYFDDVIEESSGQKDYNAKSIIVLFSRNLASKFKLSKAIGQ